MVIAQSKTMAFYCGLKVEVLQPMENCSLIRHDQRDFVVDTVDVIVLRRAHQAPDSLLAPIQAPSNTF